MVSENWEKIKQKISKRSSSAGEEKKEAGVWFEVDEASLKRSEAEALVASGKPLCILDLFPEPKGHRKDGKFVAMDCEFVGVGADGMQNALARVSLVNYYGEVLLDTFVRPKERIIDYRSEISGVRPEHMRTAADFSAVQLEVVRLLSEKIVVGHGLYNDFRVLMLSHPRRLIRDTSKHRRFRAITKGMTPSLRRLAKDILGVQIHEGEHDSVDDARVAMLLYRSCKDDWENALFRQEGKEVKAKKRDKKLQQRSRSATAADTFLSNVDTSSMGVNLR